MEYFNLERKVNTYKSILQNTRDYRETWKTSLKEFIKTQLTNITTSIKLEAEIEEKVQLENLEAVVLSLGQVKSGMYQEINSSIKRHMIKHNGSLIYQQLFNGKVMVVINYPFIENYGKPNPPKTIAIYRPEELKEPYFVRHMEEFMTEITNWEDYDDDEPNKRIGYKFNFEQNNELTSKE